jgi:hypothetical protein
MRVALMQPYLFPYVGYFQLMSATDLFVVRDDVQFIKGGWINRNRILQHGKPEWITLPIASAVHSCPINERQYLLDSRLASKLVDRVAAAYRRAPFFERTMVLVEEILSCRDTNVASFNLQSLRRLAHELQLEAPILVSSDLVKRPESTGVELVVEICRRVNATTFVNSIGGFELYDPAFFRASGLELVFLQCEAESYPQFGPNSLHIPSLSIVDVLMFNDLDTIRRMLGQFRLITPPVSAVPNEVKSS